MYFVRDTLDDLLGSVYRALLKSNNRVSPTKGPNREAVGVLLKLKNPRSRFSRTEQRATLFSCLGETLWYFSGSDRLDVIEYYIKSYRKFCKLSAEAISAEGAYGPRIFGKDQGQLKNIITLINNPDRHDTRQAVIQIFDKEDMGNNDVPCTCTIQFLARGKKLHVLVSMRSNDAYRGLPHDIFAFTMLQEFVARHTNHELGTYNHAVGSLHLYDKDEDAAKRYIAAGWPEKLDMPPMPKGDPSKAMDWLLEAERLIREGGHEIPSSEGVEPYWIDLARLLLIKKMSDQRDLRGIIMQKREMSSPVYDASIRGREIELQEAMGTQLVLPGFTGI
ncbi:thymidylate synthase [Agrobacterium vitis]|uniref:Thymidylate synthase n=1 Tax=Agrobacterium vitis TaxID=373 RepID=A0ABD6GB30_AGRVI|nr:thymidylate synthase [Agrobacterium vitis]MUO78157.1 thymidylate synthase [Agrobacterium vitis]MUO94034.1 thymidylate synthase [Agrobacterium vitis]MUP03511.1 thymidylate synthase [Agrobacterium vitis]MUZ85058.1 thymidylate synthase [Agrobacterium vitis]MVA10148.1 thymidylate synthase [Agrobacterium vitis]